MMKKLKYCQGITMIELMIVVAVVAVITSIAYPAYDQYVTRAKRSDAKAALLDTANKMEKALYTWGNYNNGGSATLVTHIPGIGTTSSPDSNYVLSFSTLSATSYNITATPSGSFTDTKCGALSLDQAGEKTATGDNETCWR